ncbi:MAG: glycosyltransferase family 2 protein [Pseudomonadota bacterium]
MEKKQLAEWVRIRVKSYFRPHKTLKLFCAGIVRNEIDILEIWLDHLESLFDHVIIYDHKSDDGTRERLLERAASSAILEARIYDEEGHAQSELMTKILHELKDQTRAGWVFFLDADEFLFEKDRNRILKKLIDYRAATVFRLNWINVHAESGFATLSRNTRLRGWYSPAKPKVAVNLRYVSDGARIAQGNHKYLATSAKPVVALPFGHLLHVPIRSEEQLMRKVRQGIAATDALPSSKNYNQHWREMLQKNLRGADTTLRTMVYRYGAFEGDELASEKREPPDEQIEGRLEDLVFLDDQRLKGSRVAR